MLNLSQLNALNREEFVRGVGPVFEKSPWIAEKTWERRPFAGRDELHAALCQTVMDSNEMAKLELIRAHPDLAARIRMTDESVREQASAGMDRLSGEDLARLEDYNRAYREKFGFPFVICARLNTPETIMAAFPARLDHSVTEEKKIALDEIFKIADLRLREIVQ